MQHPTMPMRRVLLSLSMGVATLMSTAAVPAQTVLQIPENNNVTAFGLNGAAPTRVCSANARWLRLGFDTLVLHGTDRLTLTGSTGDRLVLEGNRWSGRSFHTRALRGSCVSITRSFSDSDSRYVLSGFQASAQSLDDSTAIVAGAGDICDSTPNDCRKTSDLVIAADPVVVLGLGDNVYTNGTLAEFNTRYDPNWGRFKGLVAPVPGNHEYLTSGAAGYFDYFNGVGNQTGPAGDRSLGYYSYDVGEWHFIALNSKSGSTVSSTQLAWLDADLRANTKPCTAAYMHYPYVSSGRYTGYATMKPIFDRLYASRADLLIVGHDHNYERFMPMDGSKAVQDDGVRQVIVGTGGGDMYTVLGTHPLFVVGQGNTFGILKLTLGAADYVGEFVPVEGKTWTDSFDGACHRAGGVVGDYLLSATASITIPRKGSGGKVVTVASYGGFNAPVALSITGLPTGVTATWSFSSVTPPADGNTTSRVTLRVSSSASPGTYPLVVTGFDGQFSRTVTFSLIVKSS
jgi:hypothetical protein